MPQSESNSSGFLAGVIEGFYGQPWAPVERRQLFQWMAAWGMNTYFYCLKDDWKNRAIWREDYSDAELAGLKEWVEASHAKDVHFVYGLSPGLDIRYSDDADAASLRRRFEQMLGIGCRHFALLFDDIPDRIEPSDLARWGSLASAQCGVTNSLFAWTRERRPDARFLFCPTPYCGRMAAAGLGGEGYLEAVGRELSPGIEVLWTGPEIISRTITVEHVEEMTRVFRRKPVIWDNLHANDYDGGRFFCGPYSGRPTELKAAVSGILTNPNCEFALNYVPLRTLAAYLGSRGPWDARAAYLDAMKEWLSEFGTSGEPFTIEDLVLFGDSFYLPHEEGASAARVYEMARDLLGRAPDSWGDDVNEVRRAVVSLREVCARMSELRNRRLFHALWRRAWALREEADLLDRYLGIRSRDPGSDSPAGSDFHLPGTYRGGLVARFQRLLSIRADGSFEPTPPNP
ncbi:MAG: beta-N-acetylglucosaminidase domain-containing protein [Limisphaerales bacterium]